MATSQRKRKREPEIKVQAPSSVDYSGFKFEITHRDPGSNARTGKLHTPHGILETPAYVFCGTKGALKNLSVMQAREAGAEIILGNTYHLMIQPGSELVQKMGGLHKFTGWDGPMMTDSGGFQVFSMGHGGVADEMKGRNRTGERSLLKITEEGAAFRSYRDGSKLFLTPESSIQIQRQLGADLIYQFDECTAYHDSKEYTAMAMERSHRWGDRCLVEMSKNNDGQQALYGIVQGGVHHDLRQISANIINDRPFFGAAVGGCFGDSGQQMYDVIAGTLDALRDDRIIHNLGVGKIKDIFQFVKHGGDTFDCVSPTRIARHGWALIKGHPKEQINLRNARFRDDPEPLDERMNIPASRDFSKAYLHHLFKAGELLGIQLVAQHNMAVMAQLMREVRQAIREGNLDELKKEWLPD